MCKALRQETLDALKGGQCGNSISQGQRGGSVYLADLLGGRVAQEKFSEHNVFALN